jgi:hypothetical protein
MSSKRRAFRFTTRSVAGLLAVWVLAVAIGGAGRAQGTAEGGASVAASEESSEKTAQGPRTPDFSPQLAGRLAELLRQDWKDRPEWADMAIALLKGQGMGPGSGWWKPSLARYDWTWLSDEFDWDGDGRIGRDDLSSGFPYVDQCFARLDRDEDGFITAADLDWSDSGSYIRRSQMAGGVFGRLDRNSNGRIAPEELDEFFQKADRDGLGYLTREDLLAALNPPDPAPAPAEDEPPHPLELLAMLLNGQMGVLASGPGLDEEAPDFTLARHDGQETVTLRDARGKRPVVLIFGSFT